MTNGNNSNSNSNTNNSNTWTTTGRILKLSVTIRERIMRTKYATCKYFNRIATGDRAPRGNRPQPAAPHPLTSRQLPVASWNWAWQRHQFHLESGNTTWLQRGKEKGEGKGVGLLYKPDNLQRLLGEGGWGVHYNYRLSSAIQYPIFRQPPTMVSRGEGQG